MSQHSQRTQEGPGSGHIVGMAAATAVSSLATGFVTGGPQWDARKVVATLLGMALAGFLLAKTLGLMAERAVIHERVNRIAQDWRELDIQNEVLIVRERELAIREREQALRERVAEQAAGEVQDWMAQAEQPEPPLVDEPRYEAREEGPRVHPRPSAEEVRNWVADPDPTREGWIAGEVDQAVTGYLNEELDPAGYPRQDHVVHDPGLGSPLPYLTRPEPRQFDYRADAEPRRTPEPWNAFEPAGPRRAALASMAVPLASRDPDGYVDPGPYSTFVPPVPVSPGRTTGGYELDCDGTCGDSGCPAYVDRVDRGEVPTEVIRRYDADATEVISRVR